MPADRWLSDASSADAPVRLFCFPFAGGGASFYRSWGANLWPEVDVRAVQLPGRENRLADPPARRLAELVPLLRRGLEPAFDRPFAIFGHSMGALVGFELARALRREGNSRLVHLFVSAHRAPAIASRRRYHELDNRDLRDLLRRMGGSPDAVLEHDELMELLLETVRADFELCETYRYQSGPPLEVPITVFGGTDDEEAPPEELGGWRDESISAVDVQVLAGGHFFLNAAIDQVLPSIASALAAPG